MPSVVQIRSGQAYLIGKPATAEFVSLCIPLAARGEEIGRGELKKLM